MDKTENCEKGEGADFRSQSMESGEYEEGMVVEFSVNGNSMKATDVEAKLDEGNIQEAESSLREGLSLNFEVILHIICSFWYEKKNHHGPRPLNLTG